jgi:hypothetical protein
MNTLRRKCYRDWNISDYGHAQVIYLLAEVVGWTNCVTFNHLPNGPLLLRSGLGLIKYGADYFSVFCSITNDAPVLRKTLFVTW